MVIIKRMLNKTLIYVFLLFFTTQSFAEILGEFSIDEIVLNTSYEYTDPKQSRFSLDGSLMSLKWEKQNELSVTIGLGPLSLLNTPIYVNKNKNEFGLIEAKAKYWGAYGEVSMGLLPVMFAMEGALKESERFFYRGLLFSKKIIALRDFGVAYAIKHSHFYTRVMVHNGESKAENPDGRIFYSANWGWQSRKFEFGVSAQTGEVKPESLNNATEERLGLFDDLSTIKTRSAAVSLKARSKYLDIFVENYVGQVEQENKKNKWQGWHGDIIYKSPGRIDALLRFDYLDPNRSIDLDSVREVTLGFSLRDKNRNSRVFIYATKVIDEGKDIANDRYSLVWRLQPNFFDNP